MTKSSRQIMQERETYRQKGEEALERQEQRYKSMKGNRDILSQQYQNEEQQLKQETTENSSPQSEKPRIQQLQLLKQRHEDSRVECLLMDHQMRILYSMHRERLRKFDRGITIAEQSEDKANVAALAALSLQVDTDEMEE